MKGMPYLSIKKAAKVSLDKMIMFLAFKHTPEYAKRDPEAGSYRNVILANHRDFEKNASFSESRYLASLAALHERNSSDKAEAYTMSVASQSVPRAADYWQNAQVV